MLRSALWPYMNFSDLTLYFAQMFADTIFDKQDYKNNPLAKGEYDTCRFTHCDFAGSDLSQVKFIGCTFESCNLSLAKILNTGFQDVVFKDCKMLGLRFDTCDAFALTFRFDNCTLNNSTFYQLKMKKTQFKNTQLQEVDFTEADLGGAVFDNCDLPGAVFDHTVLEKADLTGAHNYSIDPQTNKIKKARFALSEVEGLLHRHDIVIDRSK